MRVHPSPNFDERAVGCSVRYIVLHYTGMADADEALARLSSPEHLVSAHYMLDEQGELTQIIDEENRAWHAGVSQWCGQTDINSLSIGIELVNPGHEGGYTPFPQTQIDALKPLLKDIMQRYQLPPSCLLAHSDIAPLRKSDPGELFPWPELAHEGLGLWPTPLPDELVALEEQEEQSLLEKIGYNCSDGAFLFSRQAFLRRYHPENLQTGFDLQSKARLRALFRQMERT